MRANARTILIEALGDAHRWLDELMSDPRQTLKSLAWRECKTERSIRMTLSLAFLAPDVVKAEVEGRLPRGYGLKRLVDLPMAWPDQWRALDSQRRRGRKEPSALAYRISRLRLVSCPGAIATVVDQASRLSGPQLAHVDHVGSGFCKQQLWKRNCAARTLGPAGQRIVAQTRQTDC